MILDWKYIYIYFLKQFLYKIKCMKLAIFSKLVISHSDKNKVIDNMQNRCID